MGRGRSGALFFVLFVGLDSVPFTADGKGGGTAGRLGWTDTEHLLTCSAYAYNARNIEKSVKKSVFSISIYCIHSIFCCVCAPTCGAGGLSIWGLRICKASSRGFCFFLNFPSGLLNIATQENTEHESFWHRYKVEPVCVTLYVNTVIPMLWVPGGNVFQAF